MILYPELIAQITAHASACLPEEACGLIGGTADKALVAQPITNELHSPVRFRMDPAEQLQAFLQFESQGLDLLAIYHSHPNGPPHPSPTDIEEFLYPGVLYLILSPGPPGWQVRELEYQDGLFVPTQTIM
jgi:proteasome lid subunit RPN8/RPN11